MILDTKVQQHPLRQTTRNNAKNTVKTAHVSDFVFVKDFNAFLSLFSLKTVAIICTLSLLLYQLSCFKKDFNLIDK